MECRRLLKMKKDISIIGMPMDLGQMRRGVDMGPSAIRYAGIEERLEKLNYHIHDLGDIHINRPNRKATKQEELRNLDEIVDANEKLRDKVSEQVKQHRFPLVLGGDHSIAIGTLAGLTTHYSDLGVIWYDAHGDINTPDTSPSGNIHGMPLAVSLGHGHEKLLHIFKENPKIEPENVVIIGARDLDEGEKELLKKLNVTVYSMHEIDRKGMPEVVQESLQYLQERTDGIHLSFDLDGINPTEAPGVGTPVIGGLTYRESHLALEMFAES